MNMMMAGPALLSAKASAFRSIPRALIAGMPSRDLQKSSGVPLILIVCDGETAMYIVLSFPRRVIAPGTAGSVVGAFFLFAWCRVACADNADVGSCVDVGCGLDASAVKDGGQYSHRNRRVGATAGHEAALVLVHAKRPGDRRRLCAVRQVKGLSSSLRSSSLLQVGVSRASLLPIACVLAPWVGAGGRLLQSSHCSSSRSVGPRSST